MKRIEIKEKYSFAGFFVASLECSDAILFQDYSFVEIGNDGQEQVNDMKKELEKYKARCERLEREKDELTLMKKTRSGTGTINGTGSESMRLQQRIRELETLNEDLIDDKRSAELRASELERDLESRPSATQTHKVSNSTVSIIYHRLVRSTVSRCRARRDASWRHSDPLSAFAVW